MGQPGLGWSMIYMGQPRLGVSKNCDDQVDCFSIFNLLIRLFYTLFIMDYSKCVSILFKSLLATVDFNVGYA